MDYRIMEKNGEVRVDETLTGIKGRAFYSSLNIIIIIITWMDDRNSYVNV